jgi:ligand-binding sensor domain-containing protein
MAAPFNIFTRTTRRRAAMLALVCAVSRPHAVAALEVRSAPPQYALHAWGKHDGLPGSWVYAIVPSRTGYLWIATPDGLLRFDGARLTVYDRRTAPGLPSDNIRSLCEGRDGRLWVGTFRGLAVGASDGNGSFAPVAGGPTAPVRSIVEAGDGSIWALTSQAVWHIDGTRITSLGKSDGLPGDAYRSLHTDADRRLWLSTNAGLARLDGTKSVEIFTVLDGLVSDDVLSVLFDRAGSVWVGTGKGIARRQQGGRFERVAAGGMSVTAALLEDRERNVWAGTRDGLVRIADGSSELMGRSAGLADEHISALAEDRDGNLWIGSEAGGIARLRDGRAVVVGAAQGLTHEVVWSVLERRDGSVWAGTDGGGLNRLLGLRAGPAKLDKSFAKENVYALFEDRTGRIWFSTGSHGLCRSDGQSTKCFTDPFGDDLVRCLIEDKAGRLWVGTSTALMRIEGDKVIPVAIDDGRKMTVTSFEESPSGVLWVGTTTGLARVEGGSVRRVSIAGKTHADYIDSMHADPDETLWLATTDAGLQRIRAGMLSAVTSKQGLPSDTVLSVLTDGQDRFWLSSGQGIVCVARSDLEAAADGRSPSVRAIAITEADGMRDRECSGGVQPSAWRGRDGRIWYPTIAGVVVVNPARVKLNVKPPVVLIEEIVADGRRFMPGTDVVLPAGTRHLEIHYSAPNFVAPERLRFQHRLEGLDPLFFEAGSERLAHYTGLGPGRYRFRVRAANEDGVWDEGGTAYEFAVRPYVWQTSWFYAVCIVTLLSAAAGASEWRVRSLRRREQELSRRVSDEMARVRVLSGMLPICAWCKKVRDDAGYWNQIEAYIRDHSQASFTHGICPDCLASADPPADDTPRE